VHAAVTPEDTFCTANFYLQDIKGTLSLSLSVFPNHAKIFYSFFRKDLARSATTFPYGNFFQPKSYMIILNLN